MSERVLFWVVLWGWMGSTANGQTATSYVLPECLNEVSGLEFLNDSTLIGINDGGNAAEVYLLNLQGERTKTVRIVNATNVDWEALARDEDYLYIGDIGNNLNKRRDLVVYKVALDDVQTRNEVNAARIELRYKEQISFPPKESELKFDAEGLAYANQTLWLFTKNRSVPWDGISLVYQVPTSPGNYTVAATEKLFVGGEGWWADAITGADIYEGKAYFTTYNRICIFNFAENHFIFERTIPYRDATQKESIVVQHKGQLFVADEKQALFGGGKLYEISTEE